jgi:hypothetical protein
MYKRVHRCDDLLFCKSLECGVERVEIHSL